MASAMSDKTDDNIDPYKQIIPKEIGSLDSSDGNEGDAFINNLEFRRWLILFVFVLIQITNGGAWATYVGITSQTEEYYSASLSQVIWLANVFLIIYLSLSFLGSWLIYRYFAISTCMAALVTCIGGWLRVASGKNIDYAILSQLVIAIAQIFILETPALLAEKFFHSSERILATSIGVYSNYAGIGLGYLFSPLIVGNDTEKISNLLFIEAIILSVPLVLCLFIIKDKPQKPANFSSTVTKADFLLSIKTLWNNRFYLGSALMFSLLNEKVLGNSWSLTTILDSFLDKNEISQNEVGYIGLVYIFSGSLAGLGASLFLEIIPDSKKYVDIFIKISSVLATLFLILLAIFIKRSSVVGIFLINAFMGIGIVGLTPFACMALIEASFPVQESISINVFYFFASIFSCAGSNLATIEEFGEYGLWVLVIMQLIPTIPIVFFYKTKFVKMQREGRHSSFHDSVKVLPFFLIY